MSITDKLKNKKQELKGKAKQTVGSAKGDRHLHAEGVKDEKVGENDKDVFT